MKWLRALFPSPGASALLALFWLLLVNELSAAQATLAVLLGLALPPLTWRFRAARPPVQRFGAAAVLVAVFAYDVVIANLAVARAVLGPMSRIHPRFVRVPLDLTDAWAVTLLAGLVSLTPGTVSVDIDLRERVLTIHALLEEDEVALVRDIKTRYESRIKEIFQC